MFEVTKNPKLFIIIGYSFSTLAILCKNKSCKFEKYSLNIAPDDEVNSRNLERCTFSTVSGHLLKKRNISSRHIFLHTMNSFNSDIIDIEVVLPLNLSYPSIKRSVKLLVKLLTKLEVNRIVVSFLKLFKP
uniref:UDPG_MGDP_dh_N domain-containing protein n=1 Tax=Strongyloides venezuelensis TaxID=75913 RepID=A0A0K0FPZ2_STRVS